MKRESCRWAFEIACVGLGAEVYNALYLLPRVGVLIRKWSVGAWEFQEDCP